MKITIFWTCKHKDKVQIVQKHKLPEYVSINGETPADVSPEVLERLKQGERMGFLRLRNKN